MLTETGGRGGGFRYVWSLQPQRLGCKSLISSRFQHSQVSEMVEFSGNYKVAMSLGKSLLATSSGVGSGGWALLQRRQDTRRYGCNNGCDNDAVYKRLMITVIVT